MKFVCPVQNFDKRTHAKCRSGLGNRMVASQLLPRADGDKLRDDWEGNLRREVPVGFTAMAGLLLVALAIISVAQFQYLEQASSDLGFELVSGASVMLQTGVEGSSSVRAARLQSLAEEAAKEEDSKTESKEEDADDVIRFENDYKVGGGDLEVPVSMIDYSNLGEGSIVDQRYPRRLPGADELDAEWSNLFSGDWGLSWDTPKDEPYDENDGKLQGMGVNVNGHYADKEDASEAKK